MKKITLLLFAIGIFTTFGFTILQGGDTPVEGIDIIIERTNVITTGALDDELATTMNNTLIDELNSLKGLERSVYLSKYITPIFEKATNEKGLEKAILKGLIDTRCIECKSYEVFEFKVPSIESKKEYLITLNVKFDTKWITVITERENFEKPIANPHNFELIDTVNELESKLKPEQRKELVKKFKKTDFSKLKNREEVFKNYIGYFEDQDRLSRIKKGSFKSKKTLKKETKSIEMKKQ